MAKAIVEKVASVASKFRTFISKIVLEKSKSREQTQNFYSQSRCKDVEKNASVASNLRTFLAKIVAKIWNSYKRSEQSQIFYSQSRCKIVE